MSKRRILFVGGPLDSLWSEIDDATSRVEAKETAVATENATLARQLEPVAAVYIRTTFPVGEGAFSIFRIETLTPEQAVGYLLAGYKKGSTL